MLSILNNILCNNHNNQIEIKITLSILPENLRLADLQQIINNRLGFGI